MKFPAPTHPSHLRSPAIHIHLPEAPRARCVMRRKRTREEEGSCLHVRVQRGAAWWDGQLWRQYQEHVTAWPYQLPIPSFQGTGSTGERGSPGFLPTRKTRKTTNSCRQDIWQKILQGGSHLVQPKLSEKTWESGFTSKAMATMDGSASGNSMGSTGNSVGLSLKQWNQAVTQ